VLSKIISPTKCQVACVTFEVFGGDMCEFDVSPEGQGASEVTMISATHPSAPQLSGTISIHKCQNFKISNEEVELAGLTPCPDLKIVHRVHHYQSNFDPQCLGRNSHRRFDATRPETGC
jgi:tartrate dehydratase alpha subunit/fumarate hydratase class I-like protein